MNKVTGELIVNIANISISMCACICVCVRKAIKITSCDWVIMSCVNFPIVNTST